MNWVEKLTGLFRLGCSEHLNEDTNRRICVINLFTLFGIFLTLSFAINAYREHSHWMALCIFCVCALLIAARAFLAPEKRVEHQILPASLLIISLTVLMSVLIITGGIDNTGPLWIFILPPLALFFAGHQYGLILMSLFVVFISILLFYPNEQLLATSYSFEYKLRLVLSFVTTVMFSAVYEFTRQQNFNTIQELNRKNNYLALHDQLTGLPNRRYVQNYLTREIARAKRHNQPLAIILCDIDKFKRINDQYGHDYGDEVLIETAKLILNSLRKQDLVARWGGEEFLLVLPETQLEQAETLGNLIRAKLSQHKFTILPPGEKITMSFGVTALSDECRIDEALSQADKALYCAKHKGRNQVVVYDIAMTS